MKSWDSCVRHQYRNILIVTVELDKAKYSWLALKSNPFPVYFLKSPALISQFSN